MAVGDKLVNTDHSKTMYKILDGKIGDLKSTINGSYISEHPSETQFVTGRFGSSTGGNATNTEAISVNGTSKSCYGVRTSIVSPKITKLIRADGNVYPFLLGTNSEGTYQGWWNGSGFVKTNYTALSQSIDVALIAASYPDYRFKMCAFDVSVATQPTIAEICNHLYYTDVDRKLINNLYLKDENYATPDVTRASHVGFNSGIETTNGKYARTALFDPGKYVAVGINSNDYAFCIAEYGDNADISNGTGFLRASTYYTNEMVIVSSDAKKIVINVHRKDDATLGTNEGATIKNALVFYRIPLDTKELIIEQPCTNIIRDGGFCKIFKTIGVVGDSLSSGSMHSPDLGPSTGDESEAVIDKVWYSWIQQMARYTGATAFNFSMGGLSAHSIRYSTGNENVQQILSNLSNVSNICNAYFIALGHNDKTLMTNNPNDYSIGTVADIDTSNAENNADTYCGNIGWVISKIKSYAPSAKIFLITMKAEGTFHALNEALRTIPDVFNTSGTRTVYLLDMGTYAPRIESSWEYLNGHGSPQGYLNYSWQVSSYVDWYIRHYPNEFKLTAFYQ